MKTHNNDTLSQDEGGSGGEQEILPDSTVGILRRMAEEIKCPICLGTMERPMSTGCNHTFCHECILHALSRSDGCPLCKTHIHKRGLNKVDHLEQVIEAFNQLKEAFEQEDGHTLSQAPRYYDAEPQENLTQLYPYPEKMGESSSSSKPVATPTTSSSARASTVEPALAIRQPSPRLTASPPTQSTLPEQSQQLDEINVSSDIDCFDVDLDSVSADQAALLAEKMLAMILLGPPSESPSSSTAPSASASRGLNRLMPHSHPPARKIVVKQENDEDQDDDPTQPRQDLVQVKAEPSSSLEDSASFFNGPTQERASEETSFVLCGTYLTPQKKTRMDSAAKILKGKTLNDLTARPTHVVMDIRLTASQAAGYWVDETSYQIADNEMGCNPGKLSRASRLRGDPPLFTHFEFQLAGTFVTPTRDEIELMVKTGGGTITPKLFQRDRSAAITNSSSLTRHVLLYDQASDGVMSLKKLRSEIESTQLQGLSIGKVVAVVPCKSLLDCISQYDMDKLVESIPF
ncbi:Breast cancer 1, early onset [Mortierella sp. 14UC]|nr:Breast cancer 1, early onset [Mortierella sp. 14UC]